jgi:hypothetical protein
VLRVLRRNGVIELVVEPPPAFDSEALSDTEDFTGDIGPEAGSLLQPIAKNNNPASAPAESLLFIQC